MDKIFTGIGSRDMPEGAGELITDIAKFLADDGYILRSGGASGCDDAFEKVYKQTDKRMEIYLPWDGFGGRIIDGDKYINGVTDESISIAKDNHPYWKTLSKPAKYLMARNTMQVLGEDCETPTDFIICYTKNGRDIGGTSQALRIAQRSNIPIFNIGNKSTNTFPDFMIFYSYINFFGR